MNKAASELGKLAKGVPKNYTASERRLRAERLRKARVKRWAGHKKKKGMK